MPDPLQSKAEDLMNINDTVIKDGFWKASEICKGQFAAACKKHGVQ